MARTSNGKIREFIGSWTPFLEHEFHKPYMKNVGSYVAKQRKLVQVYPEKDQIFRAYQLTSFQQVKVVIIGQDPYHNGQADGLAFSSKGKTLPASLRVIFKEIEDDLNIQVQKSPDLTRWAEQGVFLLNTALTVRAGEAGSHMSIGWETFTKRTIDLISRVPVPTVFILWGKHAQGFRSSIHEDNHLILEAPHPASELYSGGNSGFYGCKHFSKTNQFLTKNNLKPIQWI